MANYSLITQNTFEPFSYQDMLNPVLTATQAHQDLENKYDELSTKADIWEGIANEQTDPVAYKQYKKYADDLHSQIDQLAREGLNSINRKELLNMKTRYSKEIIPIENAYTLRQKDIEEQRQAHLKDPTTRFSREASTTSLDKYLENPQLSYESFSGAMLTKRVADAVKNYADSIVRSSGWSLTGPEGQLLERIQQYGLTGEDIQVIRNNPKAFPEITQLINDVVNSTKVNNWNNQDALDYAYSSAYEGLYAGLGKRTIDVRENKEYLNPYERWKFNNEKGVSTGDITDEEVYLPEVEIGVDITEPDDFDISGIMLGADGTLTSKEIEELNTAIKEAESGKAPTNTKYSSYYNDGVRGAQSGYRSSIINTALVEYSQAKSTLQSLVSRRDFLKRRGQSTEAIDKQISALESRVKNLGEYSGRSMTDPAAKLKAKKAEIEAKIQGYYDKYKHLSDNPALAVQLGISLDNQRSILSNKANIITFGDDKNSTKYIIDTLLQSAKAGTTTGIYEVDENGKPKSEEIKKKNLPEISENMTLLSSNYGLMLYDEASGEKYLLKSDRYSRNLSNEAKIIDNYLLDFSNNDAKSVIPLSGNIAVNGKIYDEANLIESIINSGLGIRKDGTISATLKQKDGDIINVVIYDVNSGSPKIVAASMYDIISQGGSSLSDNMRYYRTHRGTELLDTYVNRVPSATLPKDENYIIRK